MEKSKIFRVLPFVLGFMVFVFILSIQEPKTALARPDYGDSCDTCHNAKHSSTFVKTHGATVIKSGMTSCSKCHKSTDFCAACHKNKVQPKSWAQVHAKVKKNDQPCVKCHTWAKK